MISNRTPQKPPDAIQDPISHYVSPIPANVIIPPNNQIHAPEAVPFPDPPKNEKRGGTAIYAALHCLTADIYAQTENGKRRNQTCTERFALHDDGTEPHKAIARERLTCLRDGTDGVRKASKN